MGRTLGSGNYAIVKEAIHIKTGQYYACKVINKNFMEGREQMVSPSPFSKHGH
jgi:calcium/calmodulin-dependent protein kinase I